MIKLWAKLYKDHKILRHTTLNIYEEKMDYSLFFDYVSHLSHELDAPTPLVIKDSIFNFAKFNYVKFVPSDYVEKIDFDYLIIELVKWFNPKIRLNLNNLPTKKGQQILPSFLFFLLLLFSGFAPPCPFKSVFAFRTWMFVHPFKMSFARQFIY